MAEEHRTEGINVACADNCGVFGSPTTMDMCSKCYYDFRLKEERASGHRREVCHPRFSLLFLFLRLFFDNCCSCFPRYIHCSSGGGGGSREVYGVCRCRATFCGGHRYLEQHRCTFNFKAAGREAAAVGLGRWICVPPPPSTSVADLLLYSFAPGSPRKDLHNLLFQQWESRRLMRMLHRFEMTGQLLEEHVHLLGWLDAPQLRDGEVELGDLQGKLHVFSRQQHASTSGDRRGHHRI